MIDPAIPLIDLHRHLEGCVRLETMIEIGRAHNLDLPAWEVETLREYVVVTKPEPGVMAFLFPRIQWMINTLVDYDVCRRIAYESVEDAHREGIHYLELRFSPRFMAAPHNLDAAGVVEAVVNGAQQAARDTGIKVKLIGIMSRTYGVDNCWTELNTLLTQKDHIAALDLAGDEIAFPGHLFVEHFRRGRDAGWHVTVHAGEATGAESIWQAIYDLGATRIGHGIRAVEDPALLDYLAEHRIGLETNLTSNVQTSVVPDYASHPLRQLVEHDIPASINSDDPVISGIDLPYEYRVAATAAGLTPEQIRQVQANALETAFLSAEEKQTLLTVKP
jgi:adenosine deaminase